MTDIIFLLLIFFMITSTIIFPAAIDVNLPQSGEQTALKPVTEVYLTAQDSIFLVPDRNDSTNVLNKPVAIASVQELQAQLAIIHQSDSLRAVALYADSLVNYGKVVRLLDAAARNNIKMVLATKASADLPDPAEPTEKQ